jgi:hypothetical protein
LAVALSVYLKNIGAQNNKHQDYWRIPSSRHVEAASNLQAEVHQSLQITVPIINQESFDYHIVRCSHNWRNNGMRKDWVWVKDGDDTDHGALHGMMACRLLCLFRITETTNFKTHDVAMVEALKPLNGGKADSSEGHGLVSLSDWDTPGENTQAHRLATLQRKKGLITNRFCVSIGSVMGAAHILTDQVHPPSGKYFANPYVDFTTYNTIY